MKRRFLYILPIIMVLLLTGCTPVPEAYGDIRQAKKLYEALDSAHVVMLDNKTGEPLMDFSFYINKKDEMIFSYESSEKDEMAYSDGKQFFYKTGGDSGWTAITPKDEAYIYNIYNRKYRYPYARGALFFVDADSVSSAETAQDGGDTLITYVYDCEKLNDRVVSKLENVTAFSVLTCVYRINSDGYITEFTETGSLTDETGTEQSIDMTYRVMEMNGISVIENPVDYVLSE
ncbi:MAG: hypothetical protein K2N38_08910 [Oscillospiraceae bacterium]|nr:hypothetical protein [Oscillospiraceae bacterium]